MINSKKSLKFLFSFLFVTVTFMNTGCTPGMLGDMGGKPQVNMTGEALTPVSPDSLKIVNMNPSGTSTFNPTIIDNYIKKNFPNAKQIADINASSTGYGNNETSSIRKIVKIAAKLGANTVLITGERESGGELGNIMGDKVHTIFAKALFVSN